MSEIDLESDKFTSCKADVVIASLVLRIELAACVVSAIEIALGALSFKQTWYSEGSGACLGRFIGPLCDSEERLRQRLPSTQLGVS